MFKIVSLFVIFFAVFIFIGCNGPSSEAKEGSSDTLTSELSNIADSVQPAFTDSLVWEIEQLLQDSSMMYASNSIVISLDSVENVIYSHNPRMSLIPASVTKLITTATAFEKAGGRTNRTLIQYSGQIVDGHILKGNIIIKGGGDPTLGRNQSKEYLNRFGQVIKRMGIDSITGKVIADADVFDDEMVSPGWLVGEAMSYYAGVTPGLMVNENLFTLSFNVKKKGLINATPDNMKPFVHGVKFHNMTKSFGGAEAEIYFIGMPYNNTIEIRGYVPESMTSLKMAGILPDPPLAVATEFAKWLRQNGVRINDTATTTRAIMLSGNSFKLPDSLLNRKTIDSLPSRTAGSLVGETNKYSNNLFAETILKLIGQGYKGTATRVAGIAGIYAYLSGKKIDTRGLYLFDGSGISRANAIPSQLLVEMLSYIKNKSGYYKEYRNTLSEAGEDGTLARLCKNTHAQKHIFAKSGTMTRVVNYAGYAETLNGHTIIFSLINNNFSCSIPEMKSKLEKVMIRMVEWTPDTTKTIQ
ncbi:MAG: D-alanyl-D-alanine carboxypeptidase/D-alanyl-D-alanine-endopeptidase [Bacteroidetes bacterium HGW-Bacteroidetes-21]|jgi:D-alanyl-D-alanine carboxypeptidase/D-alanyl-D-alanine-endopeptidase (penicillin-binding protein 4)|nr:MAG: D-alanyl-D-alanine carboxypeptidase/D-alanyl-D-alanine-endopeptidase [Bacteroidetes bacterium HGW-Bacteroidetes-21]